MRNRYIFSGTLSSVCTLFMSFAKNFGGNTDCTVAAIARMYECRDGVNKKTEREKVVSLSRCFGENPKVVIETVSGYLPSQSEFLAILKRIGIVPEIMMSVESN